MAVACLTTAVHGVRYHGYELGDHPNGPHGPGGWGLHVNTLPEAFDAVPRGVLGPAEDPLREAKEVLG